MKIEYTKNYIETDCGHFIIYDDLKHNDTIVFYEYKDLISRYKEFNKEGIIKLIDEYIPKAKSKLRISKESFLKNGVRQHIIGFYAPNKYVFPKFYIQFKE